jgi:uroporphyrinogen decarboxylase
MNSRERVAAVVTGRAFDRRPFAGVFSLYGARLTGCPLARYYNEPEEYLNGVSAVVEQIAPDIILSPFFLADMAEAFGGKVRYFDDQAPNLIEPAIHDLADLSRLTIPNVDSSHRLVYIREAVRGMKQRFGKNKMIGGLLLSPTEIPVMIMSLKNWLSAVIDQDPHVKQVYEIVVPLFINYANTLLAEGADFLAMPMAFTTPRILTRHLVENQIVPILREAFAEIKGPLYLHHTGTTYNEFIDLLTDLPNVYGFVTDERDDLQESRQKIGPQKVLFSGLNGPEIDNHTPEEIFNNVTAVLQNRVDDPHFVFTFSGPDVPFNTPLENLRTASDAIKAFYDGEQ